MRRTLICFLFALGTSSAAVPATQAQLRDIQVKRPHIVVHGAYLSKVEIWAVPTGTGITPDEYTRLGNARRISRAGRKETWIFAIPSCKTETRLLPTDIFAKGFDAKGAIIGKKSLPYSGASAVHDALCGAE